MAGYPIPLYREQMFAEVNFGPHGTWVDRDYTKMVCPQCEILSTQQGVWLPHHYLLGDRRDMNDVVEAIAKVCRHRDQLAASEGEQLE